MSDNDNLSKVSFENTENKHFTMIPNIIFMLNLDPYAFRLYLEYRKAASEIGGKSWFGTKKLALICNMSERQVREMKSVLSKPLEILSGKSLIKIQHRKTEFGDSDTDMITVVDIWPENFKIISSTAQNAGGVRHNVPEGGAHSATKQEPFNNTNKNNNSAAGLKASDDCSVVVFSKEIIDKFQKLKLNDTAIKFAKDYNEQDILQALEVCFNAKDMADPSPYFISALKMKWKVTLSKEDIEIQTQFKKEQDFINQKKREQQILEAEITKLVKDWTGKLKEGYDIFIDDLGDLLFITPKLEKPKQFYIDKQHLEWLKIFIEDFKK